MLQTSSCNLRHDLLHYWYSNCRGAVVPTFERQCCDGVMYCTAEWFVIKLPKHTKCNIVVKYPGKLSWEHVGQGIVLHRRPASSLIPTVYGDHYGIIETGMLVALHELLATGLLHEAANGCGDWAAGFKTMNGSPRS